MTLLSVKYNMDNACIVAASMKGRDWADEKRKRKTKMVSLFSGCGGLDLGFETAGFDIVWANDFDRDAQAVYRLNIGEIDGRDILSVGEEDIPDCDILTAGFPCQPFSNTGNRKCVHDSPGMLYKECLRIIEKKMPYERNRI